MNSKSLRVTVVALGALMVAGVIGPVAFAQDAPEEAAEITLMQFDAVFEPLPAGTTRQKFDVRWSGGNTNWARVIFDDGSTSNTWFGDSGQRTLHHSYPCVEMNTSYTPYLETNAGRVNDPFVQHDTIPNGVCPAPGTVQAAAFDLPDVDEGVALPAGT